MARVAATGVQVAASGMPGRVDQPDLASAIAPARDLLGLVTFSTAIVQVPPGRPCSSLGDISVDLTIEMHAVSYQP
jgi:hypothetical protein